MEKSRSILKEFLRAVRTPLAQTVAWGLLILVAVVGLFMFAHKTKVSVSEIEYDGRIVDRWVNYSHTEQGSFPRFSVLVETEAGQKLTVVLDRENYERATVGMRVRKRKRKGFELIRVKPTENENVLTQ